MAFVPVARLEDLWVGEMRACVVERKSVLVVRSEDGVFAFENRCAHLGLPLHEGSLVSHSLTCPTHSWVYDVRTGRGINPTRACLRRFDVRVEAGVILVEVTTTPAAESA